MLHWEADTTKSAVTIAKNNDRKALYGYRSYYYSRIIIYRTNIKQTLSLFFRFKIVRNIEVRVYVLNIVVFFKAFDHF